MCLLRRGSLLADNPGCRSRGRIPQGLGRRFAGSALAAVGVMRRPTADTPRDMLKTFPGIRSLYWELSLRIALDAGQRRASCA